MSQKRKSPPAATEGQAKLAKFACNYVATPARPAQAESCDRCQFFRAVALPSGRNRLLCMLTGEKLRTAAVGCDLFTPGKWEELWADPNPSPLPKWLLRTAERLRPLTRALALGMVESPNQVRRSKRLSSIPNAGKSLAAQTAFAVNAPAGRMPGGLLAHIGRVVTSSIREDWRLHLSRGALRPAFFVFHHPKSSEAFMHSIPLFRAASCGGRASLSFLLRKLARAGGTAALAALLGTSLSTSARVRWAMLGHVLTVVEVRHAA